MFPKRKFSSCQGKVDSKKTLTEGHGGSAVWAQMHRLPNKVVNILNSEHCFEFLVVTLSEKPDLDEDAEGEGESDEDQEPGDHKEQISTRPDAGVSPGVAVIPLWVCGVTSSLHCWNLGRHQPQHFRKV